MYERWLLGIAPAIAVPSGRARANGTRASAHVTFQRTTSERQLCFFRRQRCCLAERCLQGILPACRPIHCPASKKRRERARTSSGFSLRNRSSPQFLRRQLVPPSSSVHVSNAGPRSRDSVLMPATPPGNSHIVQPRIQPGDGSAEKQREIRTNRTGETTGFFPAHREKPRVWALGKSRDR